MSTGGSFNHFGKIAAGMEAKVQRLLDTTQALWNEAAVAAAPIDEGDLRASGGMFPGGHAHERKIGFTAAHAAPQEFGSAAHVIEAKNAAVLVSKTGQVFGKRVNHPGNADQPYIRPTAKQITPAFQQGLKKCMEP